MEFYKFANRSFYPEIPTIAPFVLTIPASSPCLMSPLLRVLVISFLWISCGTWLLDTALPLLAPTWVAVVVSFACSYYLKSMALCLKLPDLLSMFTFCRSTICRSTICRSFKSGVCSLCPLFWKKVTETLFEASFKSLDWSWSCFGNSVWVWAAVGSASCVDGVF